MEKHRRPKEPSTRYAWNRSSGRQRKTLVPGVTTVHGSVPFPKTAKKDAAISTTSSRSKKARKKKTVLVRTNLLDASVEISH